MSYDVFLSSLENQPPYEHSHCTRTSEYLDVPFVRECVSWNDRLTLILFLAAFTVPNRETSE